MQEYIELNKKKEKLIPIERLKYGNYKKEQYFTCSHIWLKIRISREEKDCRSYMVCGCIKCELNENVLECSRDFLSEEEKIMYDFMHSSFSWMTKKTILKYNCDFSLAKSIYSKIMEKNPEINEEPAIKYFEIALDNMRNINVSNERLLKRARRLNLRPDFNNWH